MNDFSDLFGLIPVEYVQSLNGNVVSPKSGYSVDMFIAENSVAPSEVPEAKDPGVAYNQQLKIAVQRLSAVIRKRYARNRYCLAILNDCEGNVIVWGTLEMPVKVSCVPSINLDTINMVCKSLKPIMS